MAGDKIEAPEPLIRNISDTALWVAYYRGAESERDDAVFRDPFAKKLAGERGAAIARKMHFSTKHQWAFTARTYLFDHFILEKIGMGADMVINLACGLDTRPYRMNLPQDLQWVEVDLPGILDYKEEILKNEKPMCRFERVRLDLADVSARRELFAQLGARAKNALIVTEGLIVYLSEEQVGALARDLHAHAGFKNWLVDLVSPKLFEMLVKNTQKGLQESGSRMQFAPQQGPRFFEAHGWAPEDARSSMHCAGKINRLPWTMKLWTKFPDTKCRNPKQPWGGAVMLRRT